MRRASRRSSPRTPEAAGARFAFAAASPRLRRSSDAQRNRQAHPQPARGLEARVLPAGGAARVSDRRRAAAAAVRAVGGHGFRLRLGALRPRRVFLLVRRRQRAVRRRGDDAALGTPGARVPAGDADPRDPGPGARRVSGAADCADLAFRVAALGVAAGFVRCAAGNGGARLGRGAVRAHRCRRAGRGASASLAAGRCWRAAAGGAAVARLGDCADGSVVAPAGACMAASIRVIRAPPRRPCSPRNRTSSTTRCPQLDDENARRRRPLFRRVCRRRAGRRVPQGRPGGGAGDGRALEHGRQVDRRSSTIRARCSTRRSPRSPTCARR